MNAPALPPRPLRSATLALLLLPALAAAPAAGPPAICRPIAIGEARSLPWDGGAFGTDCGYDVPLRLTRDTLRVLETSDDALVHMETLRRAALYVSGVGSEHLAWDRALEHELISELRAELLEEVLASRSAAGPDRRALALRWFDLGFLLGAFSQLESGRGSWGEKELARALELAPDDGACHLGTALVACTETSRRHWSRYLERAVALADDGPLLRENLLAAGRHLLDVASYEELVAEVRGASGRG